MRGRRRKRILYFLCPRSIPARAGETSIFSTIREVLGVNPRACGGDPYLREKGIELEGQSPRVRGRRLHRGSETKTGRSIPARAGETKKNWKRRKQKGVNPRACGGDLGVGVFPTPHRGQSPRVRGRQHHITLYLAQDGSIPARAGETLASFVKVSPERVNPRACGGDMIVKTDTVSFSGQSPRVRGRPAVILITLPGLRSIPARAGET